MRNSAFVVPDFAHPVKLLCGPYCARFILEIYGLKLQPPSWWLFRRFPALWAVILTLPGRMERLLRGGGLQAKRVIVSRVDRRGWLQDLARHGRTPALFVRLNGFPFAHWVVVSGLTDGGHFLIYDPLVGKGSKAATLPIGNTVLSPGDLCAIWRPFFGDTVTAVVAD